MGVVFGDGRRLAQLPSRVPLRLQDGRVRCRTQRHRQSDRRVGVCGSRLGPKDGTGRIRVEQNTEERGRHTQT